jgi:hypothetical protein
MPGAAGPKPRATATDLSRRSGDPYAEVIDGVVVEKASPSAEHGTTQGALLATLWQRFYAVQAPTQMYQLFSVPRTGGDPSLLAIGVRAEM